MRLQLPEEYNCFNRKTHENVGIQSDFPHLRLNEFVAQVVEGRNALFYPSINYAPTQLGPLQNFDGTLPAEEAQVRFLGRHN